MQTFIVTGRYTEAGIKDMVANPDDRSGPVGKMIAASGGSMHHYFITFGDTDFLIIAEAPDEESLMSSLMVAGASGRVCQLKTQLAISTATAKSAMEKAQGIAASFRGVGG